MIIHRLILISALATAAAAPAQNLFESRQTKGSTISDHSARNIGDILSIEIRERHKIKREDVADASG